jgi:hypothetical protein
MMLHDERGGIRPRSDLTLVKRLSNFPTSENATNWWKFVCQSYDFWRLRTMVRNELMKRQKPVLRSRSLSRCKMCPQNGSRKPCWCSQRAVPNIHWQFVKALQRYTALKSPTFWSCLNSSINWLYSQLDHFSCFWPLVYGPGVCAQKSNSIIVNIFNLLW